MTREARKGELPRLRVVGQRLAPWRDGYHWMLTVPWWCFFALVVAALLVVNALFAAAYLVESGSIAHARPGSFTDAFFFSVQTLATIGYGAMAPATTWGHVVVTVEAMTGMIGMALITGLTFAKFARAKARVLFSEKCVVCPRDGAPHLMLRMANWRHNQVVEARLQVTVLVAARTLEGEEYRFGIELPLVKERTASFFLTWTALHRVDEKSPFFGDDALPRLRAQKAEIFVTLTGWDETVAQTIHARYRYGLEDIAWGARFADVIATDPDGTRQIDYTRFHEVLPL